jgi:surface polysaccharide O-acyltransferase-like enzyme
MQLSKVTSWGLILGGLLGALGFLVIGIALGLTDDDIAPADELKAFQDNELFLGVMVMLFVGVFTYMAKSLLQVAQAVKVPDEWYMYMRMLVILMLAMLLATMSMWMLVSEETTVENYKTIGLVGDSIGGISTVALSFAIFILTVVALKNGAGNQIFRALIAILSVSAVVDIIDLLGFIDIGDTPLGFITGSCGVSAWSESA